VEDWWRVFGLERRSSFLWQGWTRKENAPRKQQVAAVREI